MSGDGEGNAWARPDGTIVIPYSDIQQGSSFLKATIVHETAHYYKSYTWTDGHFTSKINKNSFFNMQIVPDHGTTGYYDAIRYAGRYHIGIEGLADRGLLTTFRNPVWKQFGIFKYFHQIPHRFFSNPFIR